MLECYAVLYFVCMLEIIHNKQLQISGRRNPSNELYRVLQAIVQILVPLKSEAPDLSKVSKYILRAGSNSLDTQSQEQRAWKDHHEYHGRIFPKNWFNCFLSFSKEAINSHFTFQSKDPQESPIQIQCRLLSPRIPGLLLISLFLL